MGRSVSWERVGGKKTTYLSNTERAKYRLIEGEGNLVFIFERVIPPSSAVQP